MKVNASAVNRIFFLFKQRYGSKFSGQFQTPEEVDNAKAVWLRQLKTVNMSDVKKAMDKVEKRYPDTPPSIDEFKALVPAKAPKVKQPEYKSLVHDSIKVSSASTGMQYLSELKNHLGMK